MRLSDIVSSKKNIYCAYVPIAGRLGSGKTTLAKHLATYIKDFSDYEPIIFSFADALRAEVANALGVEPKQLKDQDFKKKTLGEIGTRYFIPENFPMEVTDETTVRQLLQWWGTEYRRAQDPNYWVKRTAEHILSIRADFLTSPDSFIYERVVFICDDVRFPNELELFRAMAREQKHSTCVPVYLRHYGFDESRSMITQNQFIKHASLDGGNPDDKEHPSEYLLDVHKDWWEALWGKGWVLSPSYGRLDTTAMIIFDNLMNKLD